MQKATRDMERKKAAKRYFLRAEALAAWSVLAGLRECMVDWRLKVLRCEAVVVIGGRRPASVSLVLGVSCEDGEDVPEREGRLDSTSSMWSSALKSRGVPERLPRFGRRSLSMVFENGGRWFAGNCVMTRGEAYGAPSYETAKMMFAGKSLSFFLSPRFYRDCIPRRNGQISINKGVKGTNPRQGEQSPLNETAECPIRERTKSKKERPSIQGRVSGSMI